MSIYGVVFAGSIDEDALEIDGAATEALRAERREGVTAA